MITLLIARHGNTFDLQDTVVRVGLKTDLPLSSSGREQAACLGNYLKSRYKIDIVFCSQLKRTQETAEIALDTAQQQCKIIPSAIFNEIDYGQDEGKTDEEVIARIGASALKDWESEAIVPVGWQVNPNKIIENWYEFSRDLQSKFVSKTIMVVTSNGIARFAPYLTGNFKQFCTQYPLKLATGSISSLQMSAEQDNWHVLYWNKKL